MILTSKKSERGAPPAVPGSRSGETGSTTIGCILPSFLDHVKQGFQRLFLGLIESGEHTRFSRRRSLLIDRLQVALEDARHE